MHLYRTIVQLAILAATLSLPAPGARADDCLPGTSPRDVLGRNAATVELASELLKPQAWLCIPSNRLEGDAEGQRILSRLRATRPDAFSSGGCLDLRVAETPRSTGDLQQLLRKVSGPEGNFAVSFSARDPKALIVRGGTELHPLDPKDRMDVALLANPVVGILISDKTYAGQADKAMHARVGAGISIAGTAVATVLLEKSDYSEEEKKALARAAGPIAGLVVGILKEALYDNFHRDRHTVDPNDAIATAMGAGLLPMQVQFRF